MEALTKQQKEQIAEEQTNYYKDLISDLEYKLIELKRNIHDKEYAIQELERMKPIQEKEGQLVKLIEVVTPSEQNLKLHEELESVRGVLQKITAEAQSVSESNNALREVNYHLKREIFKMRIVLRSQVTYQNMKDFVYNEYLDKTDNNLELNKEQTRTNALRTCMEPASLGYGFSPEPQQLKYLSKNERMIYQEKLHKMEMMVKGFKELFEKEKNNYIYISKLHNELVKKYDQIQDNNELLIRSNQLKDQKNEQLMAELQFYKKQNQNYMEQLKTRKQFNSIQLNQEQDIAVGIFSPRINNERVNTQPSYFARHSQQLSNFDGKLDDTEPKENISVQLNNSNQKQIHQVLPQVQMKKLQLKELEINTDDNFEQAPYCQTARADSKPLVRNQMQQKKTSYYDMTREECVNFIMSMSSEFFQHFDISNVKKKQLIKQMEDPLSQIKRQKRSYSNPFSYFSNESQVNFTKPPKQSVVAITKNEIQQLLGQLTCKRKQQSEHFDLFSVDVSQIDGNKSKKQMLDQDISFISNIDQQD
ncbi:unnamed protein product (macronuclear) [Paramecium tetraurelia]|uniref:Uncharacterized protein n=1 Tax=Paramecium tetraurelia TaxID=5888 RepID=A0BS52_PARTE|nr:uncharacterized protein GSPATT00031600001 [Paramecium tetraurelia]CAK61369.1 unnamed protein product [Paramecium tetraurelia]|eukprot:XP_001428767.1 hypothetical protein (macronuclear) [Paramecium tetraurelia strain d4-2]